MNRLIRTTSFVCTLVLAAGAARSEDVTYDPELFEAMEWRSIGPFRGVALSQRRESRPSREPTTSEASAFDLGSNRHRVGVFAEPEHGQQHHLLEFAGVISHDCNVGYM